ncbi:MAG: chemotaxis protein CheW [Omnitrophica WOR_2 bacterium]
MLETFILFYIGDTTYAVYSSDVQQIEMMDTVTHVPNSPDFIEGIVYIRSHVIPVVNLRQRFHLEKIPYNLRSRLIVTSLDNRLIGLAVDSAREFIRLDIDQIHQPPESLVGPGTEYLDGVINWNDRLILIVNLRRVLSFEEQQLITDTFPDEGKHSSLQE